MPQLIVLRHGESEFNKESKFCGWIDATLTEKGVSQAKNTADLLNNESSEHVIEPIDLLVTSRLKRAVSTCNVILEHMDRMDMDVIKSWRLNERHYGALQGQVKNQVLNQYGKEKFMFWRRAYDGCPPEADLQDENYNFTRKIAQFDPELKANPKLIPRAESLEMVIQRLEPFWETQMKPKILDNKNILCVTHGSVVRALMTIFFSLTKEQVEHLNIPNGMPILIDFEIENGQIKPKYDTWKYLEPEKAKIEAERVRQDGLK